MLNDAGQPVRVYTVETSKGLRMRRLFGLMPGHPVRAAHGYVYYRWTTRYMAAARFVLDRPALGGLRTIAGRWLERTHHAKVVPLEDARRVIALGKAIEWRGLEHVVPFATARDIILKSDPAMTLATCACRAVAEEQGEYSGACGPLASCLYVGSPIAEFVAEKQPDARTVDRDEALDVLERAAALGSVHTLWFKDAAGGRMYAICNCCSCCCIGLRADRAGFSPLAASGFLARVDASNCVACGKCVDACAFEALRMSHGAVAVDEEACLGCGACVHACGRSALSLTPGGQVEALPLD
jgi:ferredoxin